MGLNREIVEVNAGSGYWAHLIEQAGGTVLATDLHPWPDGYTTVLPCPAREAAVLAAQWGSALLTVWPMYGRPWTGEFLKAYLDAGGRTVIYVGEDRDGCAGDETFHDLLQVHFSEVQRIDIPQWYGIYDHLWIYERQEAPDACN